MVEQKQSGTIQELSLESVMSDRFGRYSKYIIQERALPDIRDGLKPVQRRILFAMSKDGNTYDKQFRKSAKSVGNVMGNFHPHGDSSIYEAMVRMSQDWKLRAPLIEMHGNNGSIDNDPAAAMRYTEARLSKLAGEMLRDLDKDTVEMVLNFDDTEYEPTVLPGHFPNLLVNGATGISAGYATDIPPHNLGEVIDAIIYMLTHKKVTLDDLMTFVKGPDFPTGAIIQGAEGIKSAYKTGKGKVVVRSKTEIKPLKGGKHVIEITEIPYEVNKAALVHKMDEIRANKDVAGITEVRDESDRDGLTIVVEIAKDGNADGILQYLFKKTELQVTYNFNMVAIHEQRPVLFSLQTALQAFIDHQKEIITKRTVFDLKKAKDRQHIVTGLIKALSILDEVIKAIRASKDRKDAKQSLINQFEFTSPQAEAIVTLQLYRLTNTDVTQLQAEFEELAAKIAQFELILSDNNELIKVLKKELLAIKKEYATPRLTEIQAEVQEIKIDKTVTVVDEDVVMLVSQSGYVKRASLRSFSASGVENGLRDDDSVVYLEKVNTLQHVFILTNLGNVIYRPIHEIPEFKWKDAGEHLSQSITGMANNEIVIQVIVVDDVNALTGEWLAVTNDGYIKRVAMTEFTPRSNYKKRAMPLINLKSESAQIVGLTRLMAQPGTNQQVVLASHAAQGLRYSLDEVPIQGGRTAGVKAMNLASDDYLVGGDVISDENKCAIALISNRGAFKWMPVDEIPVTTRAKKGVAIMRELKKDTHQIIAIQVIDHEQSVPLHIVTDTGKTADIIPSEHPLGQRYSNGSFVIDVDTMGVPETMTRLQQPLVLN
ncbi:DNA topoisomerase IV subunit A [Weissella diestrammenae]|uniref:DNA topoisomerase 4 subunit A n=1 Tax=Weissella diestrammenae TaxID=1162633 RepID=A0A7G9T5F8_9LACO|nr:DNA topoisomerase IV subunit A [Weissella diestrammenae]MCM0583193.1 DNA topoisomerase IV subunit A [Weissella diestrammenae]QNN75333.1 DNA topoisomerase IV subunit A [Weissella diestrammenae]